MIPAGNYTRDDEVNLYDCVVDHFKQKRMLVVYEDEQFVASTSIPLACCPTIAESCPTRA